MTGTTHGPRDEADGTHRRLLDAAVSLFARQGFRKTTVRAICEAADANVSAVKYHFGSKAALYDAALDHARLQANEANPFVQMDKDRNFHADQPPQRRLYLFIRTMLEHQFHNGEPTEITQLMAHEMMHPTKALDRLVEISARRVYQGLTRIVLDLMPPGSTEACARKVAMSVNALCYFHHLALPMIQRLEPEQRYTSDALDDLADHIYEFTLGALRTPHGKIKSSLDH